MPSAAAASRPPTTSRKPRADPFPMLLRQPTPATIAPPSAMPPDVRLMNAIAIVVFTLAAVALLAAGAAWVARRPQFSLSGVRLEGDLQRNSVTTVRANALPHLSGNFFTLDLG